MIAAVLAMERVAFHLDGASASDARPVVTPCDKRAHVVQFRMCIARGWNNTLARQS